MVVLLSRFFCALPLSWAFAIGRAFGWLWYWVVPFRLGVAKRNVARALPELSKREQRRIVRRSCDHMALVGVEVMRLPLMNAALSEELVERRGFEHLYEALEQNKGVIVVASHVGSFPVLAASQGARGEPLSAVLKDLEWKAANDYWLDVKKKTGIDHIAPKRSKDVIKEALAKNRAVGMVVDQHQAKHRAIVCSFFGQLAATSPAPARFAYETGAPIVLTVCRRHPDDWTRHIIEMSPFELESPYDNVDANIRHNTERFNRVIEGWIRSAPDQWLWMHKRWKVHDSPSGWEIPSDLLQSVERR